MPFKSEQRFFSLRPLIIILSCLLSLFSFTTWGASDSLFQVTTNKLDLTFSQQGALPTEWKACSPLCRSAVKQKTARFDSESLSSQQLELLIQGHPELTRKLNSILYTLERTEDEQFIHLDFLSEEIENGVALRKNYRISKNSYEIYFSISFHGERAAEFSRQKRIGIRLVTGRDLVPSMLSGFSSGFEKTNSVMITSEGATVVVYDEEEENQQTTATLKPDNWSGIRSRFWTLLLQNQNTSAEFTADFTQQGLPRVTLYSPMTAKQSLNFRIYSGPVALQPLQETSKELGDLLYSNLWSWMRYICLGLLFILTTLYGWIGNYGLSIIALALAVKFLMLPLTTLADRWQHEVNEIHSKLQPHLKEIKANYRGEEQVQKIHDLHKEHDTHIFFTLKSLFGFLIQIPIFIAVYTMLGENFALDGQSFLWTKNLAQPDHFYQLPFTTPFFGEYINLLPFIMTLVTILASLLFDAHTLSTDLQKKQQRQLYMMALLFFVLFYTFPAGMVLYWTSTNLIQLFKDQIVKFFRNRRNRAVDKDHKTAYHPENSIMNPLDEEQISHFKKRGFLVVRKLVDAETVSKLPQWIDEIVNLPLSPGKQMVYLEDSSVEISGKAISRIEKFLDVHKDLDQFANSPVLMGAIEQLFAEPAVIFKEKINFQPPFGGGILPHQDIQAGWLDYVQDFISIAVTVDESTEENGCTEVDVNWHSEGLVGSLWEPLDATIMQNIKFEKVPTQPGDVIFFDGFVPHQALSNKTGQQRRIIFLTYNPASQGEHSGQYYTDKRKNYPPDNERDEGKEYVFRV